MHLIIEWYMNLPTWLQVALGFPFVLASLMVLIVQIAWSNIRKFLPMLLLLAGTAQARELLGLEEMYMTGAYLNPASRDPLAPQYTGDWDTREALAFRFNVLGALYWDNQLHMETALGAPRTVGWHWMLGMRLTPQLDMFYEHHSRHTLDQTSGSNDLYRGDPTRDNFPVEDSYGIRLNIYTGTKGTSIWGK